MKPISKNIRIYQNKLNNRETKYVGEKKKKRRDYMWKSGVT